MARISTYNLDEKVSGGDKWIGSDSDFYNRTKNFTPIKLADFFNTSQSIDSSSLRFWYQTLDPLEAREFGTFSFKTEVGDSVPFSSIQSILVSKKTEGNINVSEFLQGLNSSRILIHRGSSINEYGVYDLTVVTEDIDEPEFYNFSLNFLQGNGNLLEDKGYLLSVIDFSLDISDKHYSHNQMIASDTWNVNHNLSKYPAVSVVDSGENIVAGDVQYIDLNNVTITFTSSFSGKAYFN